MERAAMTFWMLQILNGITFAALLFVLATGLSLIFGLMNIVNLAHGSLYMVGAYVGVFVGMYTGNFILAVLVGGVAVAILGILMYVSLLRRYTENVLAQVLLTLGCLFILGDVALWLWGGDPMAMAKPALFKGPVHLGEIVFPAYRLLVIFIGALVGAFLWWFTERTKYGAIVRAGVDDKEMAEGIGINIPLIMILVFGLGALLAGLAGGIGGAFIGVYPGVDFEILLLAIVVVIIGGLGSLKGALVGALTVGLVDSIGRALFPELSMFLLFAVVVIVLAIRPSGLFGRE
jgi:branched-chain amino acid transport system permease protein